MTRKFVVNVMGHVLDETDKYEQADIEGLLDRDCVHECFKPFKIFGVSVKEVPIDGPVIEKKKVMRRKVKLKL